MQNIIKLITVSLLVFILGIFYLSLNRSSNYDTKFLVGNKLADIELKGLQSKEFFTNDDFKNNKYTLINFWASWCAPCRVEHPYLMMLSKNKDIKILGINFKDKKINALKFLEENSAIHMIILQKITMENNQLILEFMVYLRAY